MKECWQEPGNGWVSYGGFPRQMNAIASLFDHMDLLILDSRPRAGSLPLPGTANVVAMREPSGVDSRRKLDVILKLPYYAGTMMRHIRRADVVHTPLPGDMPFLGMVMALLMRKPLLARYGGAWTPTAETTFMNRVTRTLMRFAARGSNVVIATGVGERKPDPGVEWLFSTSLTEAELKGIKPVLNRGLSNPPRLLYAGRLSVEKGVYQLVHAMGSLLGSGFQPMPFLTLAGEGPDRAALEGIVRGNGCAPYVRFAGQLNRSELSNEFHAADLCTQPSLTESFGKAWIDGMAHGLPVITCDVGSARACIGNDGERGWVIQPGKVEQLADAIRNALTANVDWPAMRARCRVYAEQFTIESWKKSIAGFCSARWNCKIENGRLTR
ncbi:MAG TPA: glycosyltransferase family 4 protein [Bryobacteraceae bacterium]|nr:glycosyltransferase family 4 protein [Bryobacteraceae bacterium]